MESYITINNNKAIIIAVHFPAPSKAPKIEEVNSLSKGSIPKYKIIQEPPQGRPEFLVIEILLPEIVSP